MKRFVIGQRLTRDDFTEVLYVTVVGFNKDTFNAVPQFATGPADFVTKCPYKEKWKFYRGKVPKHRA